jgi:glyoxylase-like metal-dependent hydrolase (beta-lactamase superfamily II)
MHRPIALAAFSLALAAAFFATETGAQPNSVRKIAEGVWFREGDQKQGHSNNAIIEMKDYLIVIDANFPSGARLAMADAKKLSPKPIRYVFITHNHGDHDYGSVVWTAEGATTLAYKGVVDEMNRYEPARWRQAAKGRQDVADLHLDAPEKPKQTFDKPSFVLKDSTREVRFLHFGWAHTRGDALAWLPKERILCTGDVSTNGPYNNIVDGNIANWPRVLAEAEKLQPAFVLPGHGPSGGPEILTGQAAFLVELRKAVQQAVRQGKKLEDIVTLKNGKAVATSIELPAAVQHWVGGSLPSHVMTVYGEVSENKPAGDLPHP